MVNEATPRRWGRVEGAERVKLREKVADLYRVQKLSIRQIAEDVGRSYGSVHRLLNEAEVPMRPRGQRKAQA